MEFPFPIRKIIHIDMDAFYTSVEQHDRPELRGKPIVVGGGHRGVVAAASYEARKFGVRSAMPSKIAFQKCPQLIAVRPRFSRYKEISNQIREIFYDYTDLVEPLSLDEAFLDVSENKMNQPMAHIIAKEIRLRIYQELGLTASAGISINKFLAKVASDINKPNGQKIIHPQEVLSFLESLPIEKFYGIGKVTAQKMYDLGIFYGKDLENKSERELMFHFGKHGQHYYQIVRGIHLSKVNPNRIRKSIAVEETYEEDINTNDNTSILEKIHRLAEELIYRSERIHTSGKTLTLKIKYNDFTLFTRSKTHSDYLKSSQIEQLAQNLWNQRPHDQAVRLLGLSLSNLNTDKTDSEYVQLKIPFKDKTD